MQNDLSIKVFQATDFGDKIGMSTSKEWGCCGRGMVTECAWADFKAVEAVVDATHRYKEIFYESNE